MRLVTNSYIYSLYVLFCGSKYNNTGYDNGAERRNKVRPKTVVITSFPRQFSILIADDMKSAYYIYINKTNARVSPVG